jgi:hypothetical protein
VYKIAYLKDFSMTVPLVFIWGSHWHWTQNGNYFIIYIAVKV